MPVQQLYSITGSRRAEKDDDTMTPTEELSILKARNAEDAKRIAALETQIGGEWPRKFEEYWSIATSGNINKWTFDNTISHTLVRDFGNCFRTRAEAENEAVKIRTRRKLEKMADWDGSGSGWFSAIWDCGSSRLMISTWVCNVVGHRFATRESCQSAIDAIGEADLKILFGVE
jgi:hypothetical protein